jgi:hypothetical protein
MAETTKRKLTLEWICRIGITINLYYIVSGYIVYFQTKHQLITPLIPRSTLYDITDHLMKASLIVSVCFLAGLWFYFFRKRVAAIVLLTASPVLYEIFSRMLITM